MKKEVSNIFIDADSGWEDLGEGLSRQIMGYDDQIMMVKVKFEKGAVGSPHAHPHLQTTFCAKGKFEFTVNNEKRTIKEGDGLYIPADVVHGAVCLEEGLLIDVFHPVREDYNMSR